MQPLFILQGRMGQKSNLKKTVFLFANIVIYFLILAAKLFAAERWEEIKRLEKEERRPPALVITRPRVRYQAEDKRDPFRLDIRPPETKPTEETIGLPTPETVVTPPVLTIQGIVWGGKLAQAIINNKVVKVGDTIEGAQIVDINQNGVEIFFSGRQYNFPSPASKNFPLKKQNLKGGEYE